MNKQTRVSLALLLSMMLLLLVNVLGAPDRLSEEEQQARSRVIARLDQIYAEETASAGAAEKSADAPKDQPAGAPPATEKESSMPPEQAPDVFKVKFECTNGDFIVECHKEWAPLGVERFYTLVREAYFDDCGFFRVIPGFVVQFGLAADPAVTLKWKDKRIKDDPVIESNLPGYLTFATSGPNTRTTQLFINTGSNKNLDNMGFAPFGKVVEGLDVVKKINAEYGERPNQMLITREGNKYLKGNFPNLDFVKKATLMP